MKVEIKGRCWDRKGKVSGQRPATPSKSKAAVTKVVWSVWLWDKVGRQLRLNVLNTPLPFNSPLMIPWQNKVTSLSKVPSFHSLTIDAKICSWGKGAYRFWDVWDVGSGVATLPWLLTQRTFQLPLRSPCPTPLSTQEEISESCVPGFVLALTHLPSSPWMWLFTTVSWPHDTLMTCFHNPKKILKTTYRFKAKFCMVFVYSPIRSKQSCLWIISCKETEWHVIDTDTNRYIMKWKCYHSVVSDSLQPHGLQYARLLCPWNSPGKNTRVSCCSLLQEIFPIQGSNPCLLHFWQILSCLSQQGSPRYTIHIKKLALLTTLSPDHPFLCSGLSSSISLGNVSSRPPVQLLLLGMSRT